MSKSRGYPKGTGWNQPTDHLRISSEGTHTNHQNVPRSHGKKTHTVCFHLFHMVQVQAQRLPEDTSRSFDDRKLNNRSSNRTWLFFPPNQSYKSSKITQLLRVFQDRSPRFPGAKLDIGTSSPAVVVLNMKMTTRMTMVMVIIYLMVGKLEVTLSSSLAPDLRGNMEGIWIPLAP